MADSEEAPTGKNDRSELTFDELIRSELKGKTLAVARYDSILWKVRTGYIVVLYGVVTILVGKEAVLAGSPTVTPLPTLRAVAWGIGISALIVDLNFLLGKLRVVKARNRLSDIALKLATKQVDRSKVEDEIGVLLHFSGEEPTCPPLPMILNAGAFALFLYLGTPAVLTVVTLGRS